MQRYWVKELMKQFSTIFSPNFASANNHDYLVLGHQRVEIENSLVNVEEDATSYGAGIRLYW